MATALQLDPARVAQEVISFLTTNFAATLTTIEAEYGDSISLGPVDYYWSFPQAKYPGQLNVVCYPLRTEPIHSGDLRQQHELALLIITAGDQSHSTYTSVEVLNKRAWRVQYAAHTLINNSTLSNKVDRLLFEEANFTSDPFEGSAMEQRVETTLNVFTSVT